MPTIDEMFADNDQIASFHDALLSADKKMRTDDELRTAFEALPEHIRNVARMWGMSDTVFRDQAYDYFCEAARAASTSSNVS